MSAQKAATWVNLAQGRKKSGFCPRRAIEDQCYAVFHRNIAAPNSEVAMEPVRRKLVWAERPNFQGWACTGCAWVFNPSGSLVGESLDEMKMLFEQQRTKEFISHVFAEHPRATKNPG